MPLENWGKINLQGNSESWKNYGQNLSQNSQNLKFRAFRTFTDILETLRETIFSTLISKKFFRGTPIFGMVQID